MNLKARLGKLETDNERRNETVENCKECGLLPAARINIIRLPAKMTVEEWAKTYQYGR